MKLYLLPFSLLLLPLTFAGETPPPPPTESKPTFARHILAGEEEVSADEHEAVAPTSFIRHYFTKPSQTLKAKQRAAHAEPKGPIENSPHP